MESEVLSEGDATVTARGFCFSESASGSINNDTVYVGTGKGKFSATIKNLKTNTTYYARSFAVNSFGIQYSNTIQFTTQNALPIVENTIVADIKDGNKKLVEGKLSQVLPEKQKEIEKEAGGIKKIQAVESVFNKDMTQAEIKVEVVFNGRLKGKTSTIEPVRLVKTKQGWKVQIK